MSTGNRYRPARLLFRKLRTSGRIVRPDRWGFNRRLVLESLEDRCLLSTSVSAGNEDPFLSAGTPDDAPRATGGALPTAAEIAWQKQNMVVTQQVRLNQLGLDRLNAWQTSRGRAPLSPTVASVVPLGQEVIGTTEAQREATADSSVVAGASPLGGPERMALPAAVDNSQLKFFPGIRNQGSLGSCTAFATTYYAATYMTAMARNWDETNTTDNSDKFSPKWTYNLINQGEDTGSTLDAAYQLLLTNGAATWQEVPYDTNCVEWVYDQPSVWRDAIDYRMSECGEVPNVDTDAGLQQAKALLVDGYVLNCGTYITSWQYRQIQANPNAPGNAPYVGQWAGYWLVGEVGSHLMTIVGYNDDLWVDINGNGQVDSAETGAFKIANSWGTGWQNNGFVWLSYDAIKANSAVTGGPSAGRAAAFHYSAVYWITARTSYTPSLLAGFTVTEAERNQMNISVGLAASGTTPTQTWQPYAFSSPGNRSWSMAALKGGRNVLAATSVDSKAIFAGGYDGTFPCSTVDIYDYNTSQWSMTHLSQRRDWLVATTVDTKAMFAGGWNGSSCSDRVDIYDSVTDHWSTATLSQARDSVAATSVDTKAIFAGGWTGSSYSDRVDIYDSNAADHWSTATLSEARNRFVGTTVGTKAIFAGGWNGSIYSDRVDIYDSVTDHWSTATLSQARCNLAATTVGTKAMFAGGLNGSSYSNVVDIYDSVTDQWSTATLSQARNFLAATTAGTKAIFAGGWNGSASKRVDIYDSNTDHWSTATLSQARDGLAATSVGTNAIFAGGYYYDGSDHFSNVIDVYDSSGGPGLGGARGFDGKNYFTNPGAAPVGQFVYDLTDLNPSIGISQTYFLGLHDHASTSAMGGAVTAFQLTDAAGNVVATCPTGDDPGNVPQADYNGSTSYAYFASTAMHTASHLDFQAGSGVGTYGGTTTATVTLTDSGGPLSGENLGFSLNGSTIGTATTDASGIATLTDISLAGLHAGTYSNYLSVSFAGNETHGSANSVADLTVDPAILTVTGDPKSRTYGAADPSFTASYSGFQNGETLSVSGVTGVPTLTCGDTATSPVGTYTITVALNTLVAQNYSFNLVDGRLTITKAAPTVTVSDAGGTYNGSPFAATAAVAGVVPGVDSTPASTLEGVEPTLTYYVGTTISGSGSVDPPSAVGTYTVVASFAGSANYAPAQSNPLTFAITSNLDVEGNGRADALTDGILILRYLFDPAGAWNYSDALGSGATRTTRPTIKSYLDGGRTTVLDVDGNGTPDALTDGILILRYLFDPAGQWNYSDALGAGATRTTRTAIKAFLDQYNPAVTPPSGSQAAFVPQLGTQVAVTSTIDGSSPSPIQTVAGPSLTTVDVAESAGWVTVPAAGPANHTIQNSPVVVGTRNDDQLIAGVVPAVLLGGVGDDIPFSPTAADMESTEPANTRAQDTVLQDWEPPCGYDIPIARLPASSNSSTLTEDSEALDRLYGEGGLDWFLRKPGDNANAPETTEITTAL